MPGFCRSSTRTGFFVGQRLNGPTLRDADAMNCRTKVGKSNPAHLSQRDSIHRGRLCRSQLHPPEISLDQFVVLPPPDSLDRCNLDAPVLQIGWHGLTLLLTAHHVPPFSCTIQVVAL